MFLDRWVSQLCVTALFYLENSRKIHLWGGRACQPKDVKRREWGNVPAQESERPPSLLAPLFICFFLSLGLPYVNWASQECCLFYLRSLLQSSDIPLLYFRRLFPSLSFSHRYSGLLFPILTTYQVGLWRRLSTEELMLLNCGVGEDSQESSPNKDNLGVSFVYLLFCFLISNQYIFAFLLYFPTYEF